MTLPVESEARQGSDGIDFSSDSPGRSRAAKVGRRTGTIRPLFLLLLLDAALTLGFVFRGPVEGDTLRYALSLQRWVGGQVEFGSLFNVEMSFGWYAALGAVQRMAAFPLAALPDVLNWGALLGGVLATAGLFLWWRRWWDVGVAFRLVLLFVLTPAFWSLHLYGNTNILGLAFAAWAFALLPARTTRRDVSTIRAPLSPASRFAAATLLGWAAVTTRTDVLMLAPAFLAFTLWGRERPTFRTAGTFGLLVVLGYLGLRGLVLGFGGDGGTVGHHWKSNLALDDPRWLARMAAQNVAALLSAGPPLVVLASLAAFIAVRRPALRRTVLLWLFPAVVFVFFGRMHLTRILLPVLPALLLPLAVWAAHHRDEAPPTSESPAHAAQGRGTRLPLMPQSLRNPSRALRLTPRRALPAWLRPRDAVLVGVALVGHLAMMLLPAIQTHFSDRAPGTRRVGHYAFKDVMFRQHGAIKDLATETLTDARTLFDRTERTEAPVVVLGGDVLFYEYELAVRAPASVVQTTRNEYQLRLREARVPGRDAPYFFLEPRWGSDTEEDLARLGVGPDVLRHWIPVERRLRGMP